MVSYTNHKKDNNNDKDHSTDNCTITPENIACATAYNQAFATLFPLLCQFRHILNDDGKRYLSELMDIFSAILQEQVRQSYRKGVTDGKNSSSEAQEKD